MPAVQSYQFRRGAFYLLSLLVCGGFSDQDIPRMLDRPIGTTLPSNYALLTAPALKSTLLSWSFVDLRVLVVRNGPLVLGIVGLMIALAMLYLGTTTRLYTAQTQVLIDPKTPTPLREQSSEAVLQLDNPEVESQIILVSSEQNLVRVVEKLKLTSDPEFVNAVAPIGPDTKADGVRMAWATTVLRKALEIRRVGTSHVLDISFTSPDPEKAALIANTVADSYVSDQLQARTRAAEQATDWLESRIKQLRQQVNLSALKLQEFRARRDYRIPAEADAAAGGGQKPQQSTIDELESTALTYKKLYEGNLQAFTESLQRQSLPSSFARVISYASVPHRASHPRTAVTLTVAAILGGAIAYTILLFQAFIDPTIRSARQIDEADMRCLGEVRLQPRNSDGPFGGSTEICKEAALYEAFGPEIWQVAARIFEGPGPRTLGFAALSAPSAPRLALALAGVLAAAKRRVLLVDANFSDPGLTRDLHPECGSGVRDLLGGNSTFDALVLRQVRPGIDFLPVGSLDSGFEKQIESSRELAPLLPKTYDAVLIQIPDPRADMRRATLGWTLDGVVVIAEAGHTETAALRTLSGAIQLADVTLSGVILCRGA